MYLKLLKSIKEEKHLSSGEIAKLSGIPQATISRIFSGVTPNPTFETIANIAIAMGVSLDELTGLKSPEEPPVPSQIEKTINTYADLLNEKEQRINEKNETIQLLTDELKSQRKEKLRLSWLLGVCIAVILLIMIFDILNGHLGYFRF